MRIKAASVVLVGLALVGCRPEAATSTPVESPRTTVESNAWEELDAALALLPDATEERLLSLDRGMRGDLDPAQADRILEDFGPALDAALAALEKPDLQYPMRTPGSGDVETAQAGFRALAQTAVIRARRSEDPTGELLELHALAKRLSEGDGSEAFQRAGVEAALAWQVGTLDMLPDLESDRLLDLEPIDFLSPLGASLDFDLPEVMLPRVVGFQRNLEERHRQIRADDEDFVAGFDWDGYFARATVDHPNPYDPEATEAWVRNVAKEVQDGVDDPWTEASRAEFERLQETVRATWPVAIGDPAPPSDRLTATELRRVIDAPNPAGMQTALFLSNALVQRWKLAVYATAGERAVRTLAGDQDPGPDPIDGQPLRREGDRVWSVAFDGFDDGGLESELPLDSQPDWTWRLPAE